MSSLPKASRQASTMRFTALPSVTSQIWVFTEAARPTVSDRLSESRSTAKTRAPSSAKRTAVARPLPHPGPIEPAPVTIATRSLSLIGMRSLESIKTLRVVDEKLAPLRFARRDLGDEIDHQ